jgi:hypothetical protein
VTAGARWSADGEITSDSGGSKETFDMFADRDRS